MNQQLNELETFLRSVVSNYPPLPKATNIEEKLDKAVAFREILSDYNLRAKNKIQELFAGNKAHICKHQIQKIAADCLRHYHMQ